MVIKISDIRVSALNDLVWIRPPINIGQHLAFSFRYIKEDTGICWNGDLVEGACAQAG